jgi:hypothetical protein
MIPLILGLLVLGKIEPKPRHLERVAYDSDRNKLVMFGGAAFVNGKLKRFTSVYEWDNQGWTEFNTTGPGPRNAPAMVYDPELRKTVLMGGIDEDQSGYKILFDVWTWDGERWEKLEATCPVKEPEATYDPVNRRILVYGAVSDKTELRHDGDRDFQLWQYKSNQWKKLSDTGPKWMGPLPIAYDIKRDRLVVVANTDPKLQTWEWFEKIGWESFHVELAPDYRSRFMLAYHPKARITYLHGGTTEDKKFLSDFWTWDGSKWSRVNLTQGIPAKHRLECNLATTCSLNMVESLRMVNS